MKTEISSLELEYVVSELQHLKNSRIDKIYTNDKKDIIIQLYKAEIEGKPLLRLHVPNVMYLSHYKPSFDHPSSFCMGLRKRLQNARIVSIKKMGNERIVKIDIEKKNSEGNMIPYSLYCEFFLKGNIILVDHHGNIDLLSENQMWKEREIKVKKPYNVPHKTVKKLKESLDTELVKYLADKMNLGGEFAEEICYRAAIDKHRKEFTAAEVKTIQHEIEKITSLQASSAYIYIIDAKKHVFPFLMQSLAEYEHIERYDSFNQALDAIFTEKTKISKRKEQNKTKTTRLNKFEKIIQTQEAQLKKNNRIIKESTAKGDLIYKQYTTIKDIFEKLKEARETRSWKEIKSLLKNHPIIIQIKEKEGKITLELEE